MRDSCHTEKINSSPSVTGSCKRCGSNDLFTEPAKPPHYLALRCRSCGLFAKFISKKDPPQSKLYAQIFEQVRADFDSPRDDSHKSCSERFEKIERELTVLVRAILACGVLSGKGGAPEADVDSEAVYRLVGELAESEAGR